MTRRRVSKDFKAVRKGAVGCLGGGLVSRREDAQRKGPVAECASCKQPGDPQREQRLEHAGERSEEASCRPS